MPRSCANPSSWRRSWTSSKPCSTGRAKFLTLSEASHSNPLPVVPRKRGPGATTRLSPLGSRFRGNDGQRVDLSGLIPVGLLRDEGLPFSSLSDRTVSSLHQPADIIKLTEYDIY